MSLRPQPSQGIAATDDLPRLLIIDDDPVQRMLIARAATRTRYPVTEAASLSEAIGHIEHRHFSLVTLDLLLDDGLGEDVLPALVKAGFSGTVLLISGMDHEHRMAARANARSLGIKLYSLPKPLDLAALRTCLADLARKAAGLPEMLCERRHLQALTDCADA